jgi:Domain of unknown function (DUF4956)
MATGNNNGSSATPAARVLIRVGVYYVVIAALGYLAWNYFPRTQLITSDSLDALFGTATQVVRAKKGAVEPTVDQETLAVTVMLAMVAAALVALPVAWVYTLTRAKRGYQQSVVQLLVILPVVVAGIVVMVKYSLTLAFSLGGIAAAVRFRNSLEDSKDAVYVFLVIGIGIAAAVDLPVAFVISILFNIIVIGLWMTDFGRMAVELEGRVAERRLQRARQLARTGTFVARIDEEVLANMSAEQLEGLSQRVMRRAQANSVESDEPSRVEMRLRVKTRDGVGTRAIIENRLEESTKRWSVGSVQVNSDGITVIDYLVLPKKSKGPEQLLALVKAAGGEQLVEAEIS